MTSTSNDVVTTNSDNPVAPIVKQQDFNDNVVVNSTTAFHDDGVSRIANMRLGRADRGIVPMNNGTIQDFLSKPIALATGTITSQVAGTQLNYFDPGLELNNNLIWSQKLSGYRLVRGTAVFKVTHNATPFQACKFISTFIPSYGAMSNDEQSLRNVNLGQITTQPNVELDTSETSIEMRVPYVTPYHYFDRTDLTTSWGYFFLYMLAPLRVGSVGSASFNYTIFLHFEDIELAAPKFGPESSLQKGKSSSPRRAIRVEKKSARRGALEDVACKVADVSDSVGSVLSFIPGVSAMTSGVSTLSRTLGDVFSFFGWAKVQHDPPTDAMAILPTRYAHNTSGSITSQKMSFNHDAFSAPDTEMFGVGADEMSFAYLKTIPGLESTFTWSTSQTSGTMLYENALSPLTCLYTDVSAKGSSFITFHTGTPLLLMRQFFNYWRGGFTVTLKLNKTAYHSGRLIVAFTPDNSTVAFGETQYVLREIVDLSESNEFTFHIPYLSNKNFISQGDAQQNIGTLDVYVLNELVCPDSTSNIVDVLVYYQPADDFCYMGPTSSNTIAFTPEAYKGDTTLSTKGIGNSEIHDLGLTPMRESGSDYVVSVKQLISAARPIFSGSPTWSTSAQLLYPSSAAMGFNTTSAVSIPQTDGNSLFGDYYAYLKSGYAYERGGYRIMNVMNPGTTNTRVYFRDTSSLSQATDTAPAEKTADSAWNPSDSSRMLTYQPSVNGVLDVVCPHYSSTSFRRSVLSKGSPVYSGQDDQYGYVMYAYGALTTTGWMRACYDDFQLGYFIGFPPTVFGGT